MRIAGYSKTPCYTRLHFRKSSMRRLCILIAFAFLVSACGQKGPLYLPKDGDKPKKHEPRKTEEGTIE